MADDTDPRDQADRLAIHELAVRYCDATTRGDWAQLRSVWMPDGVWQESEPFNSRQEGVEAIIATTAEMLDAADLFIQICHGVVIESIDGDEARAHATVQGISRGRRGSGVNYVIFKDRIVRAADGWRYAERMLHNIYYDVTPLPGTVVMTRAQIQALE